jgi:hypothetical protein
LGNSVVRSYQKALLPDEQVELAFHKLLEAALDQPRPDKVFVLRVNKLLRLIAHPLALEEAA